MKNKDIKNINTEFELRRKLSMLDARWIRVMRIRDSRKRSREVLRLSNEIKDSLRMYEKKARTANKKDFNDTILIKVIKNLKKFLAKIGLQNV